MGVEPSNEFLATEPVAERATPHVMGAGWEAMLDQMVDVALFFDMQGRLVAWNRAARAVLPFLHVGMSWAERERRMVFEGPDGHWLSHRERPVARALRGEQVPMQEYLVHVNGAAPRALLIGASPILVAGRQIGALSISHDITARRQAERELEERERLLEEAERLAGMGCWKLDLRTGELRWSDGMYRLLGLEPGAVEPSISAYAERVQAEDRLALDAHLQALLAGDERISFVNRLVDLGGGVRVVQVHGSLERDERGQPRKAIGVMHDITEQLEMDRMQNEFISTVSHELRTPLTAVRAPLTFLQHAWTTLAPAQVDGLLAVAVDGVDRTTRLVNDVLDMQRLATGRLSISVEPMDAREAVLEAKRALAPRAEAARVAVRVCAPPTPMRSDPARLVQVLSNLVDNAISFSPAGATVTVAVRPEGSHVRFDVSDRGPGVPPDKLEAVFQRFKQLDQSTTRRKGGTGLGLAICREIVGLLGGRIWAERRRGGGTTFSFVVPGQVPR